MSVHWVNTGGYDVNTNSPTVKKLFGKEFPPEDVKAYWSMVPVPIYVEWSAAFGMFVVMRTLVAGCAQDGEQPHVVRRQIMARDADKLAVWMQVCQELCCGE